MSRLARIYGARNGNAYERHVRTDAPVAWWRCDEASGTTIVAAIGTNGTIGGTTPLGGVGALPPSVPNLAYTSQVGATQNLDVPFFAALDFAGDCTIECWARWNGSLSATANANMLLSRFKSAADQGWALAVSAANGAWRLYRPTASGPNDGPSIVSTAGAFGAGLLLPDTWHHLAVVVASNVATLYQDGRPLTSAAFTLAAYQPTGSVGVKIMGRHGSGGTSFGANAQFPGLGDEFALYATALSAARIQLHAYPSSA